MATAALPSSPHPYQWSRNGVLLQGPDLLGGDDDDRGGLDDLAGRDGLGGEHAPPAERRLGDVGAGRGGDAASGRPAGHRRMVA